MNQFFCLSVGLLLLGCASSKPVSTPRSFDSTTESYYTAKPEVLIAPRRLLPDPINGLGQTSDPSLRLTDVQVSDHFTILHLTYLVDKNARGDAGKISFTAEKAHLVTPDGKQRFNFVRAEGIKMAPDDQEAKPGEPIMFTLYFDRITDDVTEFGLFECDDTATTTCWNVRNIIMPAPTPPVAK
jgi:hypothetical protein